MRCEAILLNWRISRVGSTVVVVVTVGETKVGEKAHAVRVNFNLGRCVLAAGIGAMIQQLDNCFD